MRYRTAKKMEFTSILVLSGFLTMLLGVGTARAQSGVSPLSATFDRVVPLAPGGRLALINLNGPIAIEGWDRDAVSIHAVKIARSQASDLAGVRIDVAVVPGRVAVETVTADDDSEVSVNYALRVPRSAVLEQVATVNGNVSIAGINGTGSLHAVNGDIDVGNSSGGFIARSTNGDIHVQLATLEVNASLVAETVNGSIAVDLPAKAAADLDVRSVNGDFHSDLPVAYTSSFSPRELRGKLGAGGEKLRLRTVNGAIRVSTPARSL